MQTKFNSENGRTTWLIDRWYQKTIYVIGVIYIVLFTLGFIAGFVSVL